MDTTLSLSPQSKEDSDIFNRFHLKGYKFVQVWKGLVYHMTCRGSRFKKMDPFVIDESFYEE